MWWNKALTGLAAVAFLGGCETAPYEVASPPMVTALYASPSLALPDEDRDRYEVFADNPVTLTTDEPVSTFSIDVDTASYALVRRYLMEGDRPPIDAVRTEELVNYFDYDYPLPEDADLPFATDVALFGSPWDAGRQLIRIGLKGYDIPSAERPRANLVFLIDTSGSMQSRDKLPLVQRSLRMLVEQLGEEDTVAIVVYAGSAGAVLEPTAGTDKAKIFSAIDNLQAGGSTAGGAGIDLAYRLAKQGYDADAVNRVILATDGDFNVGITNPGRLEDFVARERESGVYLSVLGFGRGNLNDLLMQKLAQAGNGNAAYIDSALEAQKVLVEEMGSTLFTIANDVKIQIEFNPRFVAEYRLIGYETRMLAREDFNNDRVDAGDVGSGHTVTALYEITAPDSPSRLYDDLRYGEPSEATQAMGAEVAFLRIRYKLPGEQQSRLIEQPIMAASLTAFADAPPDARFATAVAGFAQLLRGGSYTNDLSYDDVRSIASDARGDDPNGYRAEFLRLVSLAGSVAPLASMN